MDIFKVFAQLRNPGRRQVLGHDMLDRVCTLVKMAVDILVFVNSVVFKPLQQIDLIFAVHLIYLAGGKCSGEFIIAREPAALRF